MHVNMISRGPMRGYILATVIDSGFCCFPRIDGRICSEEELISVWGNTEKNLKHQATIVYKRDTGEKLTYVADLEESNVNLYVSAEGILFGEGVSSVDANSASEIVTNDFDFTVSQYTLKLWNDCHEKLQKIPAHTKRERAETLETYISDEADYMVVPVGHRKKNNLLGRLRDSLIKAPEADTWGRSSTFSGLEVAVKDYIVMEYLKSMLDQPLVRTRDDGYEYFWVPRMAPFVYQIGRRRPTTVWANEWYGQVVNQWAPAADIAMHLCDSLYPSKRLSLYEAHTMGSVRQMIEEPGFDAKTIWTFEYITTVVVVPFIEQLEALHHLGIIHGNLDEDKLVFVKGEGKSRRRLMVLSGFGNAQIASEAILQPDVRQQPKTFKSLSVTGQVVETLVEPTTPWDETYRYSFRDDLFRALEIIANFLSYPNKEKQPVDPPPIDLAVMSSWATSVEHEKAMEALRDPVEVVVESTIRTERIPNEPESEDDEEEFTHKPHPVFVYPPKKRPRKPVIHSTRTSPYRAALMHASGSFETVTRIKSGADMFNGCCHGIPHFNAMEPNTENSFADHIHRVLASIVEDVRSLSSPGDMPDYSIIKKKLNAVTALIKKADDAQRNVYSENDSDKSTSSRRRARFPKDPVTSIKTFAVVPALDQD